MSTVRDMRLYCGKLDPPDIIQNMRCYLMNEGLSEERVAALSDRQVAQMIEALGMTWACSHGSRR